MRLIIFLAVFTMLVIAALSADAQVRICDRFGCRISYAETPLDQWSQPATVFEVDPTPQPVVFEVSICPVCGRPKRLSSAAPSYVYSRPIVSYGTYQDVPVQSYSHQAFYSGQSFSGSARQSAWFNGDRRWINRPGFLRRRWR